MLPVPGRSSRPPARALALIATLAITILVSLVTAGASAAPTAPAQARSAASGDARATTHCNVAAIKAKAARANTRARRYRVRARYANRRANVIKARRYVRRALRHARAARACARATRKATTVSAFEAESMSIPQWSAVVGDTSASAGKALAVRSSSTTTKTVNAAAAGRLVVRARGEQCSGAPAMTVKLDGTTVLNAAVSASSWTSYGENVAVSRGTHTVSISFTNDFHDGCDRNLILDKVSFEAASSTTAPVSSTPTTPPPTTSTSTAPPPPAGSVALGLSASLRYRSGTDLSNTIGRLRGAGLGYSREDFAWRNIEPTRGNFNWAATDAMVQASAIQGLKLIAIPNQPPSWATASSVTPPTSGQPLADYGNFVRKAIERYGSNGSFWSANPSVPKQPITMWNIWNEPYMEMFWGPGLPNGGDYARMFKATVQAARPADPAAKFMLETETGANGYAWPQPAFLGAMFAAVPDLGSYADIASIHPYTSGNDPDICTPYSPSQGITADWKATRFQFCRVKDVRRILDANGASNTRIWITEAGYSTAPSAGEAVTEAKQAEYVRDIFRHLREWRLVDGVVFYHYSTSENNPADKEDYFGFVHRDGSAKPAWNALVDEARTGI